MRSRSVAPSLRDGDGQGPAVDLDTDRSVAPSRRPRAHQPGLGAGDLASRPNYIFSLPALAVPSFPCLVIRAQRNPARSRYETISLAMAGIVPAALVGASLAAYNYARFGSGLEFGVAITSAGSPTPQRNPSQNLGTNYERLFWRCLRKAVLLTLLPFFTAWHYYWGVLSSAPFALLALVFPATLLIPRWKENPTWVVLGLTLFAAFFLNLLSILGGQVARRRDGTIPGGFPSARHPPRHPHDVGLARLHRCRNRFAFGRGAPSA